MIEAILGEIEFFAFGMVPKGWLPCAGQLLSITANQALFSLLGTTYGGDGRTTFGLPDLRGRLPVGQGLGRNLSNYDLGQKGGNEGVALTLQQIPAHTHPVGAVSNPPAPAVPSPAGNLLSTVGNPGPIDMYGTGNLSPMAATTVASAGGGQAHENRMPYLALNPCIAIAGEFPSRP